MKNLFLFLCVFSYECVRAENVSLGSLVQSLNEQSLPIVNLQVDLNELNPDTYVPGKITLWDHTFTTSRSLQNDFDCLLRIRGGSAKYFAKKSFAVKLIDGDKEDLDTAILGIRAENSWILDAMANDRLRMRKLLCFDIWNDMSKLPYETKYGSRNGTIGRYVEVFVNGSYNGLYCLTDKIDRKLLGLKKAKVSDNNVIVRGLLYKGDKWGSSKTFSYYDNDPVDTVVWNSWELKVPDDYPSFDTWWPLMQLIDFCTGNYETFCEHWKEHFYEDNLIDYMILLFSFNILDMPFKNAYLSCVDITKDKRFIITPWDMDASFGQDWNGYYIDESGYYIYPDGHSADKYTDLDRFKDVYPFCLLFHNDIDKFCQKLMSKWNIYRADLLTPENIKRRIEGYTLKLRESGAWDREFERWKGKLPEELNSTPESAVDYAISWYCNNLAGIDEQLNTGTTYIPDQDVRNHDHSTYTLSGVKIGKSSNYDKLHKGIYIQNRRKIIK